MCSPFRSIIESQYTPPPRGVYVRNVQFGDGCKLHMRPNRAYGKRAGAISPGHFVSSELRIGVYVDIHAQTREWSMNMGFFSEFSKAYNGDEAGDRFLVAGDPVTCPHCGGTHFFSQSALLDSRGASLLNVDWACKGATVLICSRCGHVDWFAESGLVEKF